MMRWGRFRTLVVLSVLVCGTAVAKAATELATGTASGLPIPRFVSLKSDKVNVRAGPTKDHKVVWVFTRAGLPVEITAEFENWRRIRDWEGAEGWVYHSLLSGRRTGVVIAKEKDDLIGLHNGPSDNSGLVARLQPGVLGSVKQCEHSWCHFVGEKFDGWIKQPRLFGVYPNEQIE